MYFDPECVPCIIRQAHRAAKLFTNGNVNLQLKILREACEQVEILNKNFTAPHFSAVIQEIVEKNINTVNPYEKIKTENIKKVEEILPILQNMMDDSKDKIGESIRIAILGNIIDVGANPDFDITSEINRIDSITVDQQSIEKLKRDINNAETILYIGDNYEEALFDKFLLQQLSHKKLTFAVRSKPILNDVTYQDALHLGIDKICSVIESGSKIGGTDIKQCNVEFVNLFDTADLVIAKGQGNYETLLNETRALYFLFRVKCEPIALKSGINIGNAALLYKSLI